MVHYHASNLTRAVCTTKKSEQGTELYTKNGFAGPLAAISFASRNGQPPAATVAVDGCQKPNIAASRRLLTLHNAIILF